jgi:hypothetical protein
MAGLFSISYMDYIWDVIPTPLTKSIIFQDGVFAPVTRNIISGKVMGFDGIE